MACGYRTLPASHAEGGFVTVLVTGPWAPRLFINLAVALHQHAAPLVAEIGEGRREVMMHKDVIDDDAAVASLCHPHTVIVILEKSDTVFLVEPADILIEVAAQRDAEERDRADFRQSARVAPRHTACLERHCAHIVI